ncbi:MAG: hypothetical protein D6784_01755 [Chloroflexi bacterium]|nr:MAG: hypothetical protein D6784_01755 [Chloroflexota bacterium]
MEEPQATPGPENPADSYADPQFIARMEQRLAAQEYQLQEQARLIETLTGQLTEAQTRLSAVAKLEEEFNRLRADILHRLERRPPARPDSATEPATNLAAQLDAHTQALHNLRRDVDRFQRFDEQIALARAEMERLNKSVAGFQAQLDTLSRQLSDRVRAVTLLAQERETDARRLAELQADLPDLRKQLDTLRGKISLVEQQIPQFGKYEVALEELRNEIRRAREHTDFQLAERERQVKRWTDLAEAQEARLQEYKELMEKYAEHYQLNRRALASLQEFQEQLQREQHQAQELQRLAEDRLWSALQKWQAEYEQRWKKQSTEWMPKIADLQKLLDQHYQQLQKIEQFNQTVERQIDLLLQVIEEDIEARTQAAQNWQQRFEQLLSEQD